MVSGYVHVSHVNQLCSTNEMVPVSDSEIGTPVKRKQVHGVISSDSEISSPVKQLARNIFCS